MFDLKNRKVQTFEILMFSLTNQNSQKKNAKTGRNQKVNSNQ